MAEAATTTQRTTRRPSARTVSITNLLGGAALTATEMAEQEAKDKSVVEIDPVCEEKVTLAKEEIVERIRKERPRISVAFRDFEVSGNVICLTVPSRQLHDEIMHDKAELQRMIAETSGAKGLIEIDVTVNEQIKVARPITIEDRLKHLIAKNERLVEMIDHLQLDTE